MSVSPTASADPLLPIGLAAHDAVAVGDAAADRSVATTIRVPELDGLRGLMTLFVVFSHYFVEVPHGIGIFSVGWVAVIVFFVLSGYLVGRLIIEKREAANFLPVFYLRRVCRTFPTYFLTCALILAAVAWLGMGAWSDGQPSLPGWSYFAFGQNLFVLTRHSYGLHWLSPTWTLALEEQFYLFAPFLFLLAPRRAWLPALIGICLAGLAFRGVGVAYGWIGVAPLALLPSSSDVLCVGLVLAVLVKNETIDWARWSKLLRATPIALLVATGAAQRIDGGVIGPWFQVFGPFFVAVASALFILMLVKGAPEAARFRSPVLRFFGRISYSVYLTHLAVLGLLHGLVFDAAPDTATGAEIAITLAALPLTIGLGWFMTQTLEEPLTGWGRTFRWR